MAIYRFKMKIFPAIDLKNGQCVRLNKGDYQQIKTYSDDPLSVAQEWVNQGTKNFLMNLKLFFP